MNMKKAIAVFCATAMVVTGSSIPKTTWAENTTLPFDLKAPTNAALNWLEGGDSPTTMECVYCMDDSMCKWLKKWGDEATKEEALAELNALGFTDITFSAQIDWAIDDPVNGWHYTKYWDTEGQDEDYNYRISDWDALGILIYGETTNSELILRSVGDIDDNSNEIWFGNDYNPGIKSQLKDGQYDIIPLEEGGHTITLFKQGETPKRTVYARVRWSIRLYDMEGNISYEHSDWSKPAAYGAAGEKWEPYTKATLKAPVISNLKMTDETSNYFPVISFTLTVPDDLKKGATEVEARGGSISLITEARADGDEWVEIQGDWTLSSGDMSYSLQMLAENMESKGKSLSKDTKIEVRAYYYCDQYTDSGEWIEPFNSDYSNILTINGDTPTPPAPSTPEVKEGMTEDEVLAVISEIESEEDPSGTKFGYLYAQEKKSAKKAITLTWTKPENASHFIVYGAKCGTSKFVPLAENLTDTTFTQKKLKKGKYYKFIVAAYDQDSKLLGASKVVHVATKGNKKAGNYKAIKTSVENGAVTLSLQGESSIALDAKGVPEVKKSKVKEHRIIQYESSDEAVAVANADGTITAKGTGTCTVLVYGQNGIYQKITVTVTQ